MQPRAVPSNKSTFKLSNDGKGSPALAPPVQDFAYTSPTAQLIEDKSRELEYLKLKHKKLR